MQVGKRVFSRLIICQISAMFTVMGRYSLLFLICLVGLGACEMHGRVVARGGGDAPAGNKEKCSDCGMPRHVTPDQSPDSCKELDEAHKFGEVVTAYKEKATVVYVYNFSHNPALRRFYKIVRKDDNLDIQQVNMNREKVRLKSDVYLKIVNVNRFLYQIAQGDTAAGLDIRPSDLFNHPYLTDTTQMSFKGGAANAEALPKDSNARLTEIDSLMRCLHEMNNELLADILNAYNPCVVFRCCDLQWMVNYTKLANQLLEIRLKAASYGMKNLPMNLPRETDLRKAVVMANNLVRSNQQVLYPLPTNGSYVDVHFNIQTNDSVCNYFSIPPDHQAPMQYEVPIMRKWIISFSGGAFVGLSSSLQNPTYAWQQIPDNTNTVQDTGKYALIQNGLSLPPYGLTALCHLQYRGGRSFGLGFSAGIGLSVGSHVTGDGMGGVSVFLGNMRQCVVTAGILGTEVNQLTNQWQTVANKGILYVSPPPIHYYQEFKTGLFLSFTYTPGHQ
jgi:hypothetical protein